MTLMPARLADLLRDLSGRADQVLAGLILDQLTAASDGVRLAAELARGDVAPAVARGRIAEIEHQGDTGRLALVGRLRRTVSSPIDREDLFRLSRSIDDVLDTVRDFVREVDLFAVDNRSAYGPVLTALAAGLDELAVAVRLLSRAPRQAAEHALRAKKQGLRTRYQYAVSELLDQPLTADVVKATLLLGRLDAAGVHLATAADALADGVVKRFQ